MKKTPSIIAAALVLGAAPAFAGSATPAAPEPVIEQAAPVPFSSPDWTGFYGGAQLGYANIDTSAGGDDDGFIGGLTAGYDFDLGQWVVGGGLDYDFADISIAGGAADLESVFRAKLRGGYKIGNGLLYATGGYALADTNTLGSDDGYFIGAGYEYLINQSFSVGGEVLYHEFDNYNSSGVDVDATTVQVRGTFRF
ncbi:outer membrane protein [Roseovarius phycicola]|uniref:Outer membrane beta-barrel protein n=1 Tax=Roseovarius phycicola TaxID=3080976 RepID=A0ABZ2HDJ8_9RHOB